VTGAARRAAALAIVGLGTPLVPLAARLAGAGAAPGWSESFGATTGAVCVWLAAVSDPWTWPLGIANNLAYLVVFWRSKLYADALLQLVYAAISVYGIWRWRGGASAPVRPVERGRRRELATVAALAALAALALWRRLAAATDSDVPAWDASTTAASLAAQWLMSRRILENWWVWIAVDLVYVPLYLFKGLHLTAALYALFLVLCLLGLRAWGRELAARTGGATVVGSTSRA
jgi:nicotinamide mononucleotide transporter